MSRGVLCETISTTITMCSDISVIASQSRSFRLLHIISDALNAYNTRDKYLDFIFFYKPEIIY